MVVDGCCLRIIDTSSRFQGCNELPAELGQADAIVLTYACDKSASLESLKSFWLPRIQLLETKAPVIVVGCKLDMNMNDENHVLVKTLLSIMHEFSAVVTCTKCSACDDLEIQEVFYRAWQEVIYPSAPLFDYQTHKLEPRFARALKRIFVLCDREKSRALKHNELKSFLADTLHASPTAIDVAESEVRRMHGDKEDDLDFTDFIILHALFIKKGLFGSIWEILNKYNYNVDLRLSEDQLLRSIERRPDQSVELTNEALKFLREIFSSYNKDNNDEALNLDDLEDLFYSTPERFRLWDSLPYEDAAERTVEGYFRINGFLSQWALMTLRDPIYSLEILMYVGYSGVASSALRVTRSRHSDRKNKVSGRNVYNCFVFGPKAAGKSSLLNSLIKRPISHPSYDTTKFVRYAVNLVGENGKALVLQEISEYKFKNFVDEKDALATCDVAIFVHDSSDEISWEKSKGMLLKVAGRGKFPCLIVAAKADLEANQTVDIDSKKVSRVMGINDPISFSRRRDDPEDFFNKILNAAERPYESIPRPRNRMKFIP